MSQQRNSRLVKLFIIIATPTLLVFTIIVGIGCCLSFFGPSHVWFHPWEGMEEIPDAKKPHSIVFRPVKDKPNVIVMLVSGSCEGQAKIILLEDKIEVSVPEQLGKIQVFDWYAGDISAQYLPENVTEGNLEIRWKFGYFDDILSDSAI